MHVLFVHQNFPAQFGPFAFRLAAMPGYRCTFVSNKQEGTVRGVQCVKYALAGGATAQTHHASRTFENGVWHASGVHDALAMRPDIRPDVIVGHSGFGSTLFLRDLYPGVPVVNLFEYFYRTEDSDMDFRPDFPPRPEDRPRARARNAMILLDLDHCDLGYCPTAWQLSRFPAEYRPKLRVLFDGIDTDLWKPDPAAPRAVAGRPVPAGTKLVTYVARGFESMRGFDIFMRAAKKLCARRNDVLFAVVGADRVCYGGDARFTGGKTFKEWVLAQDDYDLSRFVFTGSIPEPDLARLLAASDLHIYLTVPFVLSWSLFDALACGAVVLASDTAPVREVIEHGRTGLLAPFFDPDAFADLADRVLSDPGAYKPLGAAGAARVRARYGLDGALAGFLTLCADARELALSRRAVRE
ncbi:MAG: glycosyltransferase [Planctomycetes bacterium]|nr:glycosyltransferase [Planctomycetota bacterium]